MSQKPKARQKKKKKYVVRHKPAGRLTLLLLAAVMAALSVQIIRMQGQIRAAQAEEAVVAQRLTEIQESNQQLQNDLDNSTDPALIENIARDQLGMVREGEKVFHISK